MSDLHLISHHLCPYVQRAVIVLTEKGIPHERTYIDLTSKPDWFLELSPLGRVPVLKTGDAVVFESQVIAEYLDEVTPGTLHPIDPSQKARHRSWIEFGSETLNVIAGFYNAPNETAFNDKATALRTNFERIEREISGPCFAGDDFHMIDGVWGTIFRYFDVFDGIGDFGILDGFQKCAEWRATVAERASVVEAPPASYPVRLESFLRNRQSYISGLIRSAA